MQQIKHINYRVILPILLSLVVAITCSVSAIFIVQKGKKNRSSSEVDQPTVSEPSIFDNVYYEKSKPKFNRCGTVTVGTDILRDGKSLDASSAEVADLVKSAAADGFDALNINVNTENGLIFSTSDADSQYDGLLQYINSCAKQYGMTVAATIDISKLAKKSVTDHEDIQYICSVLSSEKLLDHIDMLIISGAAMPYDADTAQESTVSEQDSATVSEVSVADADLSLAMRYFYRAVAKVNSSLYTGVLCDGLYTAAGGNRIDGIEYMLDDKKADILTWKTDGYTDFFFVQIPWSTSDKTLNFRDAVTSWRDALGSTSDVFYELSYSKLGGDGDWKKTDQILNQLMCLSELSVNGFTFDSYYKFMADTTESRKVLLKYLSGALQSDFVLKDLTMTSPAKTAFTTSENFCAFIGASDPEFSITFNGKEIERNELGYFSFDVDLELGLNTFVIEHKGQKTEYKITYKHTIIKSISPSSAQKLDGGSVLTVEAEAVAGSTVTAKLNGETITLTEYPVKLEDGSAAEYSSFLGSFTMPVNYDKNVSLGKITFSANSPKYGKDSKTGGSVTVLKSERPVTPSKPVTPEGGDYMDVGSTYVAEVVKYEAETFNGNDFGDFSRPTNNFLPLGTVDYCSDTTVNYGNTIKLRRLRCGKMMYDTHKGVDNIKVYKAELPDHNEVKIAGVNDGGRHTEITLDVLWKAPFKLDLLNQDYIGRTETGGDGRDYRITAATYSYVDITFNYATVFDGEVVFAESNPLFKSAEWIKGNADCTLRLHLKRTGQFYGWSASYNSEGQLVFSFLNPAKITAAGNAYGYSLSGVIIGIDVGHGGNDCGAANGKFYESNMNLTLALKLKAELESLGATVVMNRETDKTLDNDERMLIIKRAKPDYMIAIHRNSAGRAKPNGFSAYHYNAYSSAAANLIQNTTDNAGLYNKSDWSYLKWHNYYVLRGVSECPTVLTENGFISNASDLEKMRSDEFNTNCAKALTRGIVQYFVSIQ